MGVPPLGAQENRREEEKEELRNQRNQGHHNNMAKRINLAGLIGAHRDRSDNHRAYKGLH